MSVLDETQVARCPKCGSANITGLQNAVQCNTCGYKLFFNCAATASCLIAKDNVLLMVVRKKDPGKGLYDLPGGFVDYGETLESAARRELMEEIGVVPENLTYLTSAPNNYLYKGVLYHTTDSFFIADLPEGALPKAGDDAERIEWIPLSRLDESRIAFEPAKIAIRIYQQKKQAFR